MLTKGTQFPLGVSGTFGFSPSRNYFFVAHGTNGAEIYRTSDSKRELARLSSGFIPDNLFQRANQLFVFGYKFETKGQSPSPTAWGLVFSGDEPALHQIKEIDLSRFSDVIDMNVRTGRVLVCSKAEFLRTWGLFDLNTESYESIGQQDGRIGLFLDENLCKHLEGMFGARAKKGSSGM
jgi:hypothetical protein